MRAFLISALLAIVPFLHSQTESTVEKPKSLADCEKETPDAGFHWEFHNGCVLVPPAIEKGCPAEFECSNKDDAAWVKTDRHMQAMHEISLPEQLQMDGAEQEYRFVWVRTFDHPVVIRLVYLKKGAFVVSKMTSGHGGYAPGKIIVNKSKALKSSAIEETLDTLEGLHFWEMYSKREDPKRIVMDGSAWFIEGVKDGKYHFVWRNTPRCDDLVRELGLYTFLGNSDIRPYFDEVN